MIDRETVSKILDSVNIVDVISDFVSLRKRGANYISCCPFHDEKTPSFSVSPSKGIFKCFGCGKAGNAVTFIMEHEQMTYAEALKYLAKKYGIEVHEVEESEEDSVERLKRESMLLVSEYAAAYFTHNLFETEVGRSVGLSYFMEKRRFSKETIRKFGLGFAPAREQLSSFNESIPSLAESAIKSGYKREFLISTGLCIERGSGQLVDKFYDRVMFPIHSLSGRIIAFGGRTLRDDKSVAKYVNSPESDIYHKSRSLYGIYFAKSTIAREQKCYLVEGYADVISLHQLGITNVVASSGTSLTIEQIRLIRRFTPRITVLYDGDSAGIKASIRGIDMLLEEGLEVKVVLLPEGEDPDSFARNHALEEVKSFLEDHETDFIEFKYELFSEAMERDPIKKAELIKEIIGTIAVIPDQITRSVYIEQSAGKLGLGEEVLYREVAKARRNRLNSKEYERARSSEYSEMPQNSLSGGKSSSQKNSFDEISILDASERELLYYLLKFGEYPLVFEEQYKVGAEIPAVKITVSQYIFKALIEDDLTFSNPLYKKIFDNYFLFANEERNDAPKEAEKTDSETEAFQEKIQQRLINNNDKEMTQTVLNLIIDEYSINIKEYLHSMIPERNVINKNVPKAVLVYKLKYTEYSCNNISQKISEMQKIGDKNAQIELMKKLNLHLKVKNTLVKKLNRLT